MERRTACRDELEVLLCVKVVADEAGKRECEDGGRHECDARIPKAVQHRHLNERHVRQAVGRTAERRELHVPRHENHDHDRRARADEDGVDEH